MQHYFRIALLASALAGVASIGAAAAAGISLERSGLGLKAPGSPAYYTDNYVSLLPGESAKTRLRSLKALSIARPVSAYWVGMSTGEQFLWLGLRNA